MEKIKQAFIEVIEGEPKKEHFINVSIVTILIGIVVGIILMLTWGGQY